MYLGIKPEDWTRRIITRAAVDTVQILGIRYIGSEASGLVLIAATTNDFTFTHGDAASEVADGTLGAAGVLDLTTYTTVFLLLQEINSSDNWEAWPIDVPGDYLTNVSAGNGIFVVAAPWNAAVQAKVDAGVFPLRDTSLGTIENHSAGVSFYGPTLVPHANDGMALHEILQITAAATFAGATDGVYIYECDDINGTRAEVAHFALVTATPTVFGTGDEPLIASKGKRLVVSIEDASGAITVPNLEIVVRSYHFGPGIRATNLESAQ